MNNLLMLIITDFRGLIPQRIMAWDGYDLQIIKEALEHKGVAVRIIGAHRVDLSELTSCGHVAAIYASSQESRYKQYLQSIISNLDVMGVRLFPRFEHMLAHEDKAYQAIALSRTNIPAPKGYVFGNKDQASDFINKAEFPFVGKTADGFGSSGVRLLRNKKEAIRFVQKNMIHRALRKDRPLHLRILQRIFRPKPALGLLVFQEFIPGLKGDWKILIWGNVACGVYRENRSNDFRASGSGKVAYVEIPEDVLNFAAFVLDELKLPWGSLDIAYDGANCHLLEYQGIHFGLTAADKGLFYYVRSDEHKWEKMPGTIDIERKMVEIILNDLMTIGWLPR